MIFGFFFAAKLGRENKTNDQLLYLQYVNLFPYTVFGSEAPLGERRTISRSTIRSSTVGIDTRVITLASYIIGTMNHTLLSARGETIIVHLGVHTNTSTIHEAAEFVTRELNQEDNVPVAINIGVTIRSAVVGRSACVWAQTFSNSRSSTDGIAIGWIDAITVHIIEGNTLWILRERYKSVLYCILWSCERE